MFVNMIGNFEGGDSLSSAIFENPDILNVDPLEVNQPNTNLILLNDKLGSSEGSIDKGDEPASVFIEESSDESSSSKEERMNYGNLDIMDVVVCLASYVRAHVDLDVAIASQNEPYNRYFVITFSMVHDRDFGKIEIRNYINFLS